MRTMMTVFLAQSEKPENVEIFAKDQGLLLQLVKPVAELYARKIDYQKMSNAKQLSYVKNLA